MAKFTCEFISHTLLRTVTVSVIIPSITVPEALSARGGLPGIPVDCNNHRESLTYANRAPFPVLYLLHGMGNNHTAWTSYSNVELYAEEHNIAVVMPSAENKGYVNALSGDDFFDFISKELPDFINRMFPVSSRKEDTYLAGLSMGGYGTLLHALSTPERFCAVGAFSAAIKINPASHCGNPDAPIFPNQDLYALLQKHKARTTSLPKIYMSCGEKDFLFDDNVAFVTEIKKVCDDITWVQSAGFEHEWRFWNQEIEAFLNWIPRTDAYAISGIRRV